MSCPGESLGFNQVWILKNPRKTVFSEGCKMVVGEGFEPSNSKRADLQSAAFNHFAIPPVPLKERITYPNILVCLLSFIKNYAIFYLHMNKPTKPIICCGFTPCVQRIIEYSCLEGLS